MKAQFIYEKFDKESDPIKDMGIGLKPQEVIDKFAEDFRNYFGLEIYFEEEGGFFDMANDDIWTVVDEFQYLNGPMSKILGTDKHELLFAMNKKAANAIVKKSNWGWFYFVNGKAHYLKGAYDLKSVMREIFKLNNFKSADIDKSIKKYNDFIDMLTKFKKILNES